MTFPRKYQFALDLGFHVEMDNETLRAVFRFMLGPSIAKNKNPYRLLFRFTSGLSICIGLKEKIHAYALVIISR